jgi:hypothetical protein
MSEPIPTYEDSDAIGGSEGDEGVRPRCIQLGRDDLSQYCNARHILRQFSLPTRALAADTLTYDSAIAFMLCDVYMASLYCLPRLLGEHEKETIGCR